MFFQNQLNSGFASGIDHFCVLITMYRYLSNTCIFIFLFTGLACKSLQPGNPGSPPELPKATARINLNLDVPLPFIEAQINQGLKQQLVQEEGLELGDGLVANLLLEKRGDLSIAATDEGKLQLGLPVLADGSIRLEKRIFGQKVSTALPFREELSPEILFLPVLQDDWSFDLEELDILSLGKSLSLDVLGFQMDFEPFVKKQVAGIMEDQLRNGALAALDLKNIADSFWSSFGKPRYISNGLSGNYVYPDPEELIIHQRFTPSQQLQIGIGLTGEMLSQKDRPLATELPMLPTVTLAEVEENELDLTFPIVLSYEEIATFLNQTLKDSVLILDNKTRMLAENFTLGHHEDRVLVSMQFLGLREGKKDLRGTFHLAAKPLFNKQNQTIEFSDIAFKLETADFFTNTANWLRRRKIRKTIQKRAVIPVDEYLEPAKASLLEMGAWQSPIASFSLQNPEVSVKGIYPTRTELVIHIQATAGIETRFAE